MNKYISIITILGLFILLFLQSVWLYNSYISTKKEIIIKISDVLENAINKETFFRLGTLPEGTIVQSRPESENGKNIPEFAYMQESLIQLGAPISLDSITFNYKQLLQEEGIYNEPSVYIIQGTKITKQIGETNKSIFNIETKYIPIRPDYSLVIAATLKNPETFIFKKMGVLLISTTILLIFVIYCLLLQIKMIFRLNKISQIREDFSYAMVHDMKTPLSTIMMVQDMLESGRLDSKPEIKNKYMSIA